MGLIGTTQGNLQIIKLAKKDNKQYKYMMYYYECKCLLCGRKVILPATNIRKYVDCGRHWKEKITKRIPYKNGHTTISEISKKTKLGVYYVGRLLSRGYSAEQIITRTYPKRRTRKPSERSIAAVQLGLKRQTLAYRLEHGWELTKNKTGKYKLQKKEVV